MENLNINEIIGFAIATLGGGIGSHWVKMRRDIKAAHAKIRDLCERIEQLERKGSKDERAATTK